MATADKTIEVDVPVSTAYNQWTQFEEFPRFMDGVKEVKQIDDTHLHWIAEVGGNDQEWDAAIIEQQPDYRIAWTSTGGDRNAGSVTFRPIDGNRTEVRMIMEYELQGVVEHVGDALGMFDRRVEKDLENFKEFIESRGRETGAWRGRVA